MERADVVVIGAGLAGLQASRLLDAAGWRVVVIDRKSHPSQFVHTTGIFVRRTFEEFTFPAGTLGRPIRNVTLVSPRGRTLDLESPRDEFRIGRMAALYGAMLQSSTAEFRGGLSFNQVREDRDGAIVTLTGPRGIQRIRARVVIGADGASSRVASTLALDSPREFLRGVEEIFTVPSSGSRAPRLYCFVDPDLAPGYIGWIADDGEEIHAGAAGLDPSFDGSRALSNLRELIRRHLGVDPGVAVERRGGRIPVSGISRRIATRSALLVGDAAGAVSPLTAGGLDAALRLSTYAAAVVTRALVTGEDLCRHYSGAPFRARFVSRLWMRRLYSTLGPRSAEAAMALAMRTPLRHLAEKVFFGHGSFPIDVRSLRPERSKL